MPGSIPATSQLDWLISTTAIIVLSWSRATRDLLKSFGWGIGALHRFTQRRWCHLLAACPIASLGPTPLEQEGYYGVREQSLLGSPQALQRKWRQQCLTSFPASNSGKSKPAARRSTWSPAAAGRRCCCSTAIRRRM